MADVTPPVDRAELLQANLLQLQSRRLALISLIMAPRIEEDAPSPPISARSVLSHRLRILVAYLQLRRAIAASEALRRGRAP